MRWTETLIPTMKESPEGAEIPSHVLMLRAGLIGQVMAGAYTYLPLGLRALQKAERIVREEMDRAGAVELLMPALTPISLWQQSGRVDDFGDVLIQFKVRRQNREVHLALGPTHEEVVTDLIARHVSSYRQLPLILYQIQTKFRNEERPRFGVLRTSEFLMKDAYSFDPSLDSLGASYETMYQAYCRIFDRVGLEYVAVEAESGPIGGDASHEFMAPSENGEDVIVLCDGCDYAANLERAETGRSSTEPQSAGAASIQSVDTPGATTIEQVSKLLGCRPQQMMKTLLYLADGEPVAVLVRGDHEANESKMRRATGVARLELADAETVRRMTAAPVGFAGPVGLSCPIWADFVVTQMTDAITGANDADKHFTGVQIGRDFQVEPDRVADLRYATAGDRCPRCQGTLRLERAIEVGHVFKLGTKYSDALGAKYLDEHEQQHAIVMGCYGIGINRIIAAAIETSHDEQGIVWPPSIAPYDVLVTPINVTDTQIMQAAELILVELQAAGVDVLLDDRDQRAGVKFKDADLIGIPLRVVIGGRSLKQGKLEVKWRDEAEATMIDLAGAAETIVEMVQGRSSKNVALGRSSES